MQLELQFNIVLLESILENVIIREWINISISGYSEKGANDPVMGIELSSKTPLVLGEERASSMKADPGPANPFLAVALKYHDAGLSVIPVKPRQKGPIPNAWQRYSTTRSTKEEIEKWWKDTPDANVGIALGPANSHEGRYLFVVDQDVLKDANKRPILKKDGGFNQVGDISGCPATLSQTTGSGGKQFFYWAPPGYVVGNPKPRPLIDVKGLGGQVLVSPSIHPNGNIYSWDTGEFKRGGIAEFPKDALDALLGDSTTAHPQVAKVLGGLPIGQGLRHMGMAQVAGYYLRGVKTPEEIAMARTALYAWDREMNKSPEHWDERKHELDSTFEGILALEMRKSLSTTQNWTTPVSTMSHISKPIFACFADIERMDVSWLWDKRIALGKLTLIIGDPNVGKSLFTTAIAATTSNGGEWPVDKTPSPIGDVILLSAEDDEADTVKPRLEAAGADCRRVHTLRAIRDLNPDGSPVQRMFSLKRDLQSLEEMLSSLPECKLVIIDPVSAYLDDTDSHRNAAVRALLAPLAALAAKHKVAVVAVDHLNKNSGEGNTLYRASGSLAFVAAARAVYLVIKDNTKPGRRLVVPIKNNIARENTGLAYSIITADNGWPSMDWEPEPVAVTADEALAKLEADQKQTDTVWAVLFLQVLLANGPVKAEQILKEAKLASISEKQLRNAREKLGIKPQKESFEGGWVWALPDHEDTQGDVPIPSEIGGTSLTNDGQREDAYTATRKKDQTSAPAVEKAESEYKYIKGSAELKGVLPSIVSFKIICLDTETTGLDPLTDKIRLVQLATEAGVVIVDADSVDLNELQPVFESGATIVGHNLKFDLQFLMKAGITFGSETRFFDTLLADQILYGSRVPRSLKDVAERYLGVVLDKTEQTAKWGEVLTPEMLAYAAKDAAILLPLYGRLHNLLYEQSLEEVVTIENEALPLIAQLELTGVPIRSDGWAALAEGAKAESAKLEADLNQLAGRLVNWNSPKQVIAILNEQGISVESTGESVLSRYSNHTLVSSLLKYREQNKCVTTYGTEFLEHINGTTGRIHPNFRQIGADSGRMACSSPNMQNIPRDRAYRVCIAPKDGRVLVKADYGQVELRIAAEISGDERLIEAFKAGGDIHTLTAQLIIGKETPTKEDRQAAKAINFGLLYGMGAPKLKEYAKNTYGVDLTDDEAVKFRNKFFTAYQGLRRWHKSQSDGTQTMKTLSGRRRFNIERFTEKLNTPVQGTGADGLKAALGILWKERAKFPTAQPVLVVHDEVVIECDVADAQLVADWLKDCMKRGMERFVKTVPVEVDVTVSPTWAK